MVTETLLEPPEPRRNWLEHHEPNDTLRGVVVDRYDDTAKSGPRAGEPFVRITVRDDAGAEWDVFLSRGDLRPLWERDNVTEGDEVAIRYWGPQGRATGTRSPSVR